MSIRRQVLIEARGKKRLALRGDLVGDETVSGGVGGWESVEGKGRKADGLRFSGTTPWAVTIPLGFNGITPKGRKSVEAQCRRLLDLGRPAGKAKKPPLLKVTGLVRVPSTVDFVIDSITWGRQIRNSQGARVQQIVEVSLIQHRPAPKSPAKKANKGKKTKK